MSKQRGRLWWVAALCAVAGCGAGPAAQSESTAALGSAVVLAPGQAQPGSLAVDATNVYFIDNGDESTPPSIRRVARRGGPVTILASGETPMASLVVDDRYVYWANRTQTSAAIRRISKRGGHAESMVDGLKSASALTADAYNLYFASDGAMVRLSKLGGLPVPLAYAPCVTASAVDSFSVYWVENCVLVPPEGIFAASKLGGVAVPISRDAPGELAVDASDLYWVSDGKVESQWKLGGLPTVLWDTDDWGTVEAMDAANLYLQVDEQVVRVPKSGAAPEVLWRGDFAPTSMAVDGDELYFDGGYQTGAVYRLSLR